MSDWMYPKWKDWIISCLECDHTLARFQHTTESAKARIHRWRSRGAVCPMCGHEEMALTEI